MFETETEQMTEQRRSRMFMVLGGIGALALAIAILFLSKGTRSTAPSNTPNSMPGGMQYKLEGALRAGNPEFEAYKVNVAIEDHDKLAASNVVGMTQLVLNARLTNKGDRALSGIELTLKAFSYNEEGKVLALNTSIPIPRVRSTPLQPGESMRVTMKVDLPSKISEADVSDIVPEVSGLLFN